MDVSNILSYLFGGASLIFAVYTHFKNTTRKKLTWKLTQQSNLFKSHNESLSIESYYNGNKLEELWITKFKLFNSGNRDIKLDDGITIDLGSPHVLEVNAIDSDFPNDLSWGSPSGGRGEDRILNIESSLIKKKEYIMIEVISKEPISIDLSNVRIQDVKVSEDEFERRDINIGLFLNTFLLVICVPIPCILLIALLVPQSNEADFLKVLVITLVVVVFSQIASHKFYGELLEYIKKSKKKGH